MTPSARSCCHPPGPEDDSGESNDRRLPLRLDRRALEILAEGGLDRAGIEIAQAGAHRRVGPDGVSSPEAIERP